LVEDNASFYYVKIRKEEDELGEVDCSSGCLHLGYSVY